MKFTCSTKPLQNALKLGVVKSNISKFYQKSCLAKLTCTADTLCVNLEASRIVTQLKLHGSGDESNPVSIFVDCQVFSDLVATFDSDVLTIEFVEGGIILYSGKSRFTLPHMLDDSDLDLAVPRTLDSNVIHQSYELKSEDWKFIDNHQMFAIATNFIHPVYCRVWAGESGEILVGDYDNSIFTYSTKGSLGRTCLLPSTIINLFTSLPEGSRLIDTGSSYLVKVSTDGYEYVTEFSPESESDESVGSYNAEAFLDLFSNKSNAVTLDVPKITKFLNQASLVAAAADSPMDFVVTPEFASISDNTVECKLPIDNSNLEVNYSCRFKANFLRAIFAALDSEKVNVSPRFQTDDGVTEVVGVMFWTDELSVLLAAIE